MRTINHEGVEYVLKADMEAAIKDRITKLSTRAVQAEEQVKELQQQLDGNVGKFEQMEFLSKELAEAKNALESANSRYTRHTSMAELGFLDSDVRDLVEWSYEKAMKGKAKKDQVSFGDWIQEMKADPSKAPVTIRPHINLPTESVPGEEQPVGEVEQVEAAPALLPPKTNTGTTPPPVQSTDLLKRGAEDFEFYRTHRDEIRKAWRSKK
tara:strand:+ start:35 stop:664 length:630 start_codon:yes stop_codon:yes gene_type:complete